MKPNPPRHALGAAREAALLAGDVMRRHLHRAKGVHAATQHDIKLDLDVRCQRVISRALLRALPEASVFGEEGAEGDPSSALRWVVDPIDGTVNFTYGIPHACVSIALQERARPEGMPPETVYPDGYRTVVGVVLDPFAQELWTATDEAPALLNGRRIRVSSRTRLTEAIVALGFAKHRRTLVHMLRVLNHLVHRVRKIRIMGAAALAMTYVACGRFDAYVERGVRLWDIAAGGLILQRAGGVFWRRAIDRKQTYEIVASPGPFQRPLHRLNAHASP